MCLPHCYSDDTIGGVSANDEHTGWSVAQQRGRIGGLMKAAKAPSRSSLTSAARDARWKKYLDQVPEDIEVPQGTTLEAERMRRAELIRRADMQSLSLKAAAARKQAADARKALAEVKSLEQADSGEQQPPREAS